MSGEADVVSVPSIASLKYLYNNPGNVLKMFFENRARSFIAPDTGHECILPCLSVFDLHLPGHRKRLAKQLFNISILFFYFINSLCIYIFVVRPIPISDSDFLKIPIHGSIPIVSPGSNSSPIPIISWIPDS